MVQWLEFHTSHAGGRVQSLVRELRSHMLCSEIKTNKQTLSYRQTNRICEDKGPTPGHTVR